jgi:hypothetical protein
MSDDRFRGEPVALRGARRVRRAAWGNGQRAITAPRPRPTQRSWRSESVGEQDAFAEQVWLGAAEHLVSALTDFPRLEQLSFT